jgi:FdhD protein
VSSRVGPSSERLAKMRRSSANSKGIRSVDYVNIHGDRHHRVSAAVVDEAQICISVNGEELATFMCTPKDLEAMALGFLYNEQLIEGMEDVRSVHVSQADTCVDVWLHQMDFVAPSRQIVTAGCGGGVTFDDLSGRHEPLHSDLQVTPERLAALMRNTHLGADLYRQARGIHTAALSWNDEIALQVEDVGRHNCLDKLAGRMLLDRAFRPDGIVLSSGRISSEMINKARRLRAPVVCSRTSPTSLSVELAASWNMTIVAYLRQNRMRVYTNPWRLGLSI